MAVWKDGPKNIPRGLTPESDLRGFRRSVAVRARAPKCGAKSRQTGEPCRQPLKEEGKRCRYHGGATPMGREWHRRQLPKKGTTERTFTGKLRALERRDREAEKRRASMTEEERKAHEKRRVPKRPGTPGQRAGEAWKRRMTQEAADLLQNREKAPSAVRLADQIP